MTTAAPTCRTRVRSVQPVATPAKPVEPKAVPQPGGNWGLGGPPLQLTYRQLDTIILPARQLRQHKPKQVTQVAASITEFGFLDPVLVDAGGVIVAGVCRVMAARSLGMVEIPTICVDHLTSAQRRAYTIAANRLAELAGWDDELLRLELGELALIDLDFSVELTGFATAEIDTILLGPSPADEADPADALPAANPCAMISQLGDVFQLGDHRLICGDARDEQTYQMLMAGEKARMVFSDPPYNVKIKGNVCGTDTKHAEFAMASGEMSRGEFVGFLTAVFRQLAAASADGSIHYQCMDWRHMGEMLEAGAAAYTELKNLCVWSKQSGSMGTFYRSQHELVFVFKSGTAPHTNTFGLGETGRYRTNVWSYAGANTFRRGRMADLAAHPTVKPTTLVADAIRDVSHRGDIVLDPFCGSGTTIMAAERTGRRARCVELEPKYVDIAIRRWEELTGKQALHIETGLTLAALAEHRALDPDAAA